MSEKIDEKRIEDAIKKYEDDPEKAIKSLVDDSSNSDVKIDITEEEIPDSAPSGETFAQGYDSSLASGASSSTSGSSSSSSSSSRIPREAPTRDNGIKRGPAPSEPSQGSRPESSGLDRKEQAPDIGKDYGSAPEPKREQPVAPGTNEGSNIEDFSERQNPVDQPLPNQTPEQKEETGKESSLKKDEESKEEEKSTDKKKEEDKSTDDPSAENDKKNPATTPKEKGDKKTEEEEAPGGNGYGALDKKKQGDKTPGDGTENARRNLEHNKRVQQGKEAEGAAPKKAVDSSPKNMQASANPFSNLNLGQKVQDGLKNMFGFGGGSTTQSKGIKPGQKITGAFAKNLKSKLMLFIKTHPTVVLIIGVVIFLILIILFFASEENGSGKGGGTHCTYDLAGIVSTGTVRLESVQVELVNCDATEDNYTVLETIDFEKYVLGVALAEIGAESPDEAIKTQIVAARGFSLTRNSGMCPGNPDNCFYGYNPSTGKIRMRACEADQVYWDYEKDIYRQERGSISLYSPEITSGTLWKSALSEERKAQVEALANEVKGKVLVDSNNQVISTNYVASVSEQFISLANEGKTYDEILKTVYADKGASDFSEGQCTSYGNIDYGDYVLSSDGHVILHQRLDTFLESNGTNLEEFNALIETNVNNAGYGTRAGVVAAAVTLIAELGNNYGVKIPYYWSGGHFDGVVDGALGYWGGTHTGSVQCLQYANGQTYSYCGFDCSGFVPWAIKNGGFNISQMLAGDFQGMQGARRVSLSSSRPVLEPGDLLESEGHVVLVVGIDESTQQYICAEASGNSAGVLFTRRSYSGGSGYWGVKMDDFYATRARSN